MLSSGASPARQILSPSGARSAAIRCYAVRAACVYFALDALPDLLVRFPGGPAILVPYWKTWNAILPWFGRYVLRAANPGSLPLPISSALLGDFAGGYVLMLLFLLIALLVAAIWGFADGQKRNYRTLHNYLRVYVRYALAFSTLGYGIAKFFHGQFRSLDFVDWMTPLGMLQPRELLWDFMGFSRSYQVFTGVVECLGVALLFWRRTTLLGSLLLIGALGNVLMMDISYGVSVKRIALRLLIMALFLAAPDVRRLADLFLFDRPAAPVHFSESSWGNVWARRTAVAVKALVIVYIFIAQWTRIHQGLVDAPKPALSGLFKVQHFLRDGREDTADDLRSWRWVAVDKSTFAVQSAGATWERRRAAFDNTKQTVTLSSGPRRTSSLTYSRTTPDDMVLRGMLDDHPVEILLRRLPEPRFALNDPLALRWPSIW
jgi:hypothetical protein